MKIVPFDPNWVAWGASNGSTLGVFSGGSNSALGDISGGGDVVGQPGDYTVVGLRRQVSLASNLGPFVLGDVLTIVQTSPALAKFATPSNSAISSNALLRTTGGAGAVTTIAASGSATTLMVGGANTFDVTLTANCTLSLTGPAASGSESSILVILRQDGTGSRTVTWPGSVTWAGGSAPTLSTTASAIDFVMLETVNAGTTWFGFAVGGSTSGTTSPLTTKGDLYGYSTTNAPVAVGSNSTGLMADSSQTTGLRYSVSGLSGEILVSDTPAGSPLVFSDLLQNELQNDLMYGDM